VSYLIGPVGVLGHPFRVTQEFPVRRVIDDKIVYAFDNKWLYTDLKLVPEEPIDAVVLWDPSWRRNGEGKGAVHELTRVWEIARSYDAPVVGVYSDWFAGWYQRIGYVGTEKSIPYVDAIITDPVGAAAMRAGCPLLRVKDPLDTRYRPVVELDNFLSYGRMPTLGADPKLVESVLVDHPLESRSIDVAFIGNAYPGSVMMRAYHLERVQETCEQAGYRCVVTHKLTAEEMETTLLDTRVAFNSSLGSQLNCRVYEACAAGCLLLTDSHNVANWSLFSAGVRFTNRQDLRHKIHGLVSASPEKALTMAVRNVSFALEHTPDKVWAKVLDAVESAVGGCRETLPLRMAAEGRTAA